MLDAEFRSLWDAPVQTAALRGVLEPMSNRAVAE
jgi:hypothetical protein